MGFLVYMNGVVIPSSLSFAVVACRYKSMLMSGVVVVSGDTIVKVVFVDVVVCIDMVIFHICCLVCFPHFGMMCLSCFWHEVVVE